MNKDFDNKLRAILELQYLFGLRISEVLSIKPSQILSSSRLLIKGAKNGNSRIVVYPDTYGVLKHAKLCKYKPFDGYDRFFVYRIYKRNGIIYSRQGFEHNSVTHSLRHLAANTIESELRSTSEITELFGHKSKSSVNSYLKLKK